MERACERISNGSGDLYKNVPRGFYNSLDEFSWQMCNLSEVGVFSGDYRFLPIDSDLTA